MQREEAPETILAYAESYFTGTIAGILKNSESQVDYRPIRPGMSNARWFVIWSIPAVQD